MLLCSLSVCALLPRPFLVRQARQPRAGRTSLEMVDQNVLVGGGVALSGFVSGLALAFFAEQQIVRAEVRGSDAVSQNTRAKMSAGMLVCVESW